MTWPKRWLVAAASLAVPAAAAASDTFSYTYDALGRLTNVSVAGGRNAGLAATTGYDPAGNRTSYGLSGAGPSGQGAASQPASSGEAAGPDQQGLGEEVIAEDVPPALVQPPPPGGIPDESEPAVEPEPPQSAAGAGSRGR